MQERGPKDPKYTKDMTYQDFEMKYLIVVSTKENARAILLGEYIGKVSQLEEQIDDMSELERNEIEEEEQEGIEETKTEQETRPKVGEKVTIKKTRKEKILKEIANIREENS